MVDMHSTTMARATDTERQKKPKKGKSKEERDTVQRGTKKSPEKRETLTQLLSTVIQAQNNLNQTIP